MEQISAGVLLPRLSQLSPEPDVELQQRAAEGGGIHQCRWGRPVMDAAVYSSLQVTQRQSQLDRLVTKELGTLSTPLPPHQINKPLISYLLFEALLPLKPGARGGRRINCAPPLSVFNYHLFNGSSF